MVEQIERLCQDCQQPLVLQQIADPAAPANGAQNAANPLEALDDKLALKDSQQFQDVIDV